MKKLISLSLAAILAAVTLAGCNSSGDGSSSGNDKETWDNTKSITVVSREDGSGTRGAFIELTGIEQKDESGNKTDMTTKDAEIANKTDVMLTNVAGNDYAIGYVSLGSLNESVKALKVDGVAPSVETVKDGSYKIARPFNIATKGEPTGLAKDFIDFIMSKEGQDIINENGYISVKDDAAAYAGSKPSGTLKIGGSSSVSPVMEKLVEAYKAINSSATIEVETNDSTTGMNMTKDGTFQIGMASRELKDSEKSELKGLAIAQDGIAVIVSQNNATESISIDSIKDIYTGSLTKWDAVK